MEKIKWTKTRKIVVTSFFVCIGVILPTIFHSFNMMGNVFLPMHIPVLICALICKERWGTICGFLVPIISSILTGMPPIFPVAIVMGFELACYGFLLPKLLNKYNIYISLIIALSLVRVVSCIINFILLGVVPSYTALYTFIIGLFITALPGILIQIILIPIIYKFFIKRGLINE